MELEFFVEPGKDEDWHEFWVNERVDWWIAQGIDKKNIKKLHVDKEDLSHYSKATVDLMYEFPHGSEELEGIANRTDFDLGSHTKNQSEFSINAEVMENKQSTTKLGVQNLETKKWFIPYVIEPSAGVDRGVLAILNEAYKEESTGNDNSRIVLGLKPHLSPIKAAVIPLKRNNEDLVIKATEIQKHLQSLGLGRVILENSGNIGKGYRRHDEIGTPICITVDFESLENQTYTLRDRDTMDQKRLDLEGLIEAYRNLFN